MVIVESLVSAIVSILVTKGVQNIETTKNEAGDTFVKADGKTIARLEASLTRVQALDFLKADVQRIATTQQARQELPDYIFENPFDKDVRLVNLNLVGNANFYLVGHAEIKVNGIAVFTIEATDLTDANLDSLPIASDGIKLKRSEDVQVRVWSDDGTSVALTVMPVVAGFLS